MYTLSTSVIGISDPASSSSSSSPPLSLPLSQRNFPASFWNSDYHSLSSSSEVASAASSLASIAGQSTHPHDFYPSGEKSFFKGLGYCSWSSGRAEQMRSINVCFSQIPIPVPELEPAWLTHGRTTWLPLRQDMPRTIRQEPPRQPLAVSTR